MVIAYNPGDRPNYDPTTNTWSGAPTNQPPPSSGIDPNTGRQYVGWEGEWALNQADIASAERIANIQATAQLTASAASAAATRYSAQQMAQASMYGARTGAQAQITSANIDARARIMSIHEQVRGQLQVASMTIGAERDIALMNAQQLTMRLNAELKMQAAQLTMENRFKVAQMFGGGQMRDYLAGLYWMRGMGEQPVLGGNFPGGKIPDPVVQFNEIPMPTLGGERPPSFMGNEWQAPAWSDYAMPGASTTSGVTAPRTTRAGPAAGTTSFRKPLSSYAQLQEDRAGSRFAAPLGTYSGSNVLRGLAQGGRVVPGEVNLVGEKGPEVFWQDPKTGRVEIRPIARGFQFGSDLGTYSGSNFLEGLVSEGGGEALDTGGDEAITGGFQTGTKYPLTDTEWEYRFVDGRLQRVNKITGEIQGIQNGRWVTLSAPAPAPVPAPAAAPTPTPVSAPVAAPTPAAPPSLQATNQQIVSTAVGQSPAAAFPGSALSATPGVTPNINLLPFLQAARQGRSLPAFQAAGGPMGLPEIGIENLPFPYQSAKSFLSFAPDEQEAMLQLWQAGGIPRERSMFQMAHATPGFRQFPRRAMTFAPSFS